MHFPPLLNSDGKKVTLTRGDKILGKFTMKKKGIAKDISSFDATVKWAIVETLEDKGDPLASGTGTNLDDGNPSNRGRVDINFDLTGITDDQIDYEIIEALIEIVLLKGADENTVGPFELNIKQDAQ